MAEGTVRGIVPFMMEQGWRKRLKASPCLQVHCDKAKRRTARYNRDDRSIVFLTLI